MTGVSSLFEMEHTHSTGVQKIRLKEFEAHGSGLKLLP